MAKQASGLRKFVKENKQPARMIAVSSGKGGVGKTSVCVNTAIALASHGARVVVLDADLGLANVEVLLGLNSLYNLQQVVQGTRSLVEILEPGPGGILVVPGSSGMAQIADLGPKARQNLLNGLKELQEKADFVLIDTMAGISRNVVAFAAAADEVLLITTPEPSSIVDAYATMKTICQARPDATIRLVVNMAANEQQARATAGKLGHVAQQYLAYQLNYLGFVPRDLHVSHGVMQTHPFILRFPEAPASLSISEIAARLLNQAHKEGEKRLPSFFQRFARSMGLASNG